MQELKNGFPCSDFSIVKKALSFGEEKEEGISCNLRMPVGLEMQAILMG